MTIIAIEQIIASLAVHRSSNVVDSVVLIRCTASIHLYLLGQMAQVETQLSTDELALYKQLVTKIENRVRRELKEGL